MDTPITLPLTWEAAGFWLTLAGIAALCGMIYLISLGRNGDRDPTLDRLATRLGAQNMPPILFVLAIAIYALTALSLGIGLIWSIWTLIWPMMTGQGLGDSPSQIRFAFVPIAVYVGALGALIALPFTVLRTQFTARQTTATEEGLITDRINSAVTNLGATRNHKDADGTESSQPNLEVRIGALLALERISVKNCSKDPDLHVQIMEIICAYIRENAPASSALPGPDLITSLDQLPPEQLQNDGGTPRPTSDTWEIIREKNVETVETWTATLPATRTDIMTALQVISRRSPLQRTAEATARGGSKHWAFSENLPDYTGGDTPNTYIPQARAYREKLNAYQGYQPDLRHTNLQGADLATFNLRGIRFNDAQMQGADLRAAQMQGADLWRAQLQGAYLGNAQMQGANLWGVQMQGATLWDAQLQGAKLSRAQMQGAYLWDAQLQGAYLGDAQMQGADLWKVQMQGADLGDAQLQGANLGDAQMQGADLWKVQMQGAKLLRTQLDEGTGLSSATLQGAALKDVDAKTIAQLTDHLKNIFADGSVTLPEGTPRPAHWAKRPDDPTTLHQPGDAPLNNTDFTRQWHAWQSTLEPGWDT